MSQQKCNDTSCSQVTFFLCLFQFALLDHFYNNPCSLLCQPLFYALDQTEALDDYQLDQLRSCLSFRRYTSSLTACSRVHQNVWNVECTCGMFKHFMAYSWNSGSQQLRLKLLWITTARKWPWSMSLLNPSRPDECKYVGAEPPECAFVWWKRSITPLTVMRTDWVWVFLRYFEA